MPSDEQLMVAVASGDPSALETLYDRYGQLLYNYFLRRLGRVERSQELAHDVFVALLKMAPRYRPTAPFFALVYGIARKLLAKEYRGLKRRSAPLEEAGPLRAPGEHSERGLAVRQALAQLPERFREPLMLHVYEQLSYEEIAEALGRPIGTVRSRISRARRRLVEILERPPRREEDDQR